MQSCRHGISLGVHGGVVERVSATGYTQETGTLLESFCAHLGHIEQRTPIRERAVLGAVVDDILRHYRSHAGDIRQQVLAGSIDIHTHIVHHTFYRLVEASLEFRLIDVVLVLSDTNALRVDLHLVSLI